MNNKVTEAYGEYIQRQERGSHPDGKFDGGGRWYPSETEVQKCCKSIRDPSRAYPYSLLTHCRSMGHVARLYGAKVGELRALHRSKQAPPSREGGDDYYKVVALDGDGRMLSIFDGETEYKIGVTLTETAHQRHGGGFYVYDSPEKALQAPFPSDSKLLDRDRVLLRVRAEGSYCRYNNKLAFSRVTPLRVIEAN